tara:strand:- start:1595 stop:1882 length:288 start_codon:yes stop_codon:yes gene_type:complete
MTADETDKERIRKQIESILEKTREMTDGLTRRIEDLETEREEMINARAYYTRKASVLRTLLFHDITDVHEEWWHEIPCKIRRLEQKLYKDGGKIR